MSRKIKDLVLVVNDNKSEFNNVISNKVKEGWVPYDDVKTMYHPDWGNIYFYQQFVLYEEEDEQQKG